MLSDRLRKNTKFLAWFHTIFDVKLNSSQCTEISVRELADLYMDLHPDSDWSSIELMDFIFDTWGIDKSEAVLWVIPHIERMTKMAPDYLLQIQNIYWDVVSLNKIRELARSTQKRLHRLDQDPLNLRFAKTNTLEEFYTDYCINLHEFPLTREVPSAWRSASVSNIKKAYADFCLIKGYIEVPFKSLKEFLLSKKHYCSNGYSCGISGCSYLKYLYVPGCGDNREALIAASLGFGVIYLKSHDKYYRQDGTEVLFADETGGENNVADRISKVDTSKMHVSNNDIS